MAQARYTIVTPGDAGNQIARAAHHYLMYGPVAVEGAWIDPQNEGTWNGEHQGIYDHLVAVAEDTPETDSHMKQTAAYVGEVANAPGIRVMKDGKDGLNVWYVKNSQHPGSGLHSPSEAPSGPDTGVLSDPTERPLDAL